MTESGLPLPHPCGSILSKFPINEHCARLNCEHQHRMNLVKDILEIYCNCHIFHFVKQLNLDLKKKIKGNESWIFDAFPLHVHVFSYLLLPFVMYHASIIKWFSDTSPFLIFWLVLIVFIIGGIPRAPNKIHEQSKENHLINIKGTEMQNGKSRKSR